MPGLWRHGLHSGWARRASGLKLRNVATLIWHYILRLGNFWISLLGLASLAVVLWLFHPVEDFSAKAGATGIFALVSLLHFLDGFSADPQRRRIELSTIWPTLLSLAVLVIAVAAEADLSGVAISAFSILASLFPLWVFWMVAKGRWLWLLLFAAIPSVVAASLYLIPPITPTGLAFDYLLVPLPVLSYVCIAWALTAKWFLIRADQYRYRPIWGPAMESLSMLLLLIPLVVLTMLAVGAFHVDDTWVAVSGVIVGLIFSGAVSVPVRQFLLDLGNLSSPGHS